VRRCTASTHSSVTGIEIDPSHTADPVPSVFSPSPPRRIVAKAGPASGGSLALNMFFHHLGTVRGVSVECFSQTIAFFEVLL